MRAYWVLESMFAFVNKAGDIRKHTRLTVFQNPRASVLFFAGLLAGMVFLANYYVSRPVIQADEGSYLANAAAIAGYKNDMADSYYSGYSVLIAPAFFLAADPASIWAVVKLINSALIFFTVLLLWHLAEELDPGAGAGKSLAATTVVSLYPMWIVLAGYSFAQIAVVPVVTLVFLLFVRGLKEPRNHKLWALLGVVAGYLYWIHPTTVVVLVALALATLYVCSQRAFVSNFLLVTSGMFGMVLLYRYGLTPWLHDRMTISGAKPMLHYPSAIHLLDGLGSEARVGSVVAHLGGHLFYLSVGTVGLLWAGLIRLGTVVFGKGARDEAEAVDAKAFAILALASVGGVLGVSVLAFGHPSSAQRLDHWMYGRYVEGVIAPVLLIGAMSPRLRKGLLWAVPAACVGALALWFFGFDRYGHTAPFNVSAFWQEFLIRKEGLLWWVVSGCVVILTAAIVPRRYSTLVIGAAFVFASYFQVKWHILAANAQSFRWVAATAIRDRFPRGTCVGFNRDDLNSYAKKVYWYDFGFILFDRPPRRMSVGQWYHTCPGPFVTFDDRLGVHTDFEVHVIAASPRGGPWVWVKGEAGGGSVYPMAPSGASMSLRMALGNGWHDLERSHVRSGPEAHLRLPVPQECKGGNVCATVLSIAAFGASPGRPVRVSIRENGPPFVKRVERTFVDGFEHQVRWRLSGESGVEEIVIEDDAATSPKALRVGKDPRVLGVALFAIDLDKPEGARSAARTRAFGP